MNASFTTSAAADAIGICQIMLKKQSAKFVRKSARKKALLGVWERPDLADRMLRVSAPLSALLPGMPRLAAVPYRDDAPSPKGEGEPLTIFASCLVDRMLPAAARALEHVARSAGFDVGFPKGQWCCGLISANAGDFEAGCKLNTELTLSLREAKGLIVTPSASCFGAFTIDAAGWGAVDGAGLVPRFRDSTRFTLDLLERLPGLVRGGERTRVAYHDSCQSLRQLGLKAEPRRLLELAGYEVVEIPDIANCCGFGGTFSLDWPGVADRLAKWKLDGIARTGCTIVASDNPGCLVHVAGAARKHHQKLRVAHVLELVAERLA